MISVFLLFASACSKYTPAVLIPDDTAAPVDTAQATACDTGPEVTYDNWGSAFLTTHCQGCHASTAPNRYDAPENVIFDTQADAETWANAIYNAVVNTQTMPPAGGVTDEEVTLLTLWLHCGS